MRRIDALAIGFGVFIAGGAAYLVLQQVGLDSASAGIWSQVLLISGLIGWVATYLFRFATSNMTYHQQLRDYTQSVIEKRWETMTPEERDHLLADLDELELSPETSSPETSSPKSSSDPC
ncbi:DUF3007 family protein [Sodalinema gerasimenkoae]|uniref:DUF3007 family protein n=1 Tax=Sodalinema gerasimenkoae TaxID=2862348 RepID=UPI0013588E77|nr:DUF3007 family protein [Sodalinema gerasimenkoae]